MAIARRELIRNAAVGTVAAGMLASGIALAEEAPAGDAGDAAAEGAEGMPEGGMPMFGGEYVPMEELPDTYQAGDVTFTKIAGSTYSSASWRIKPDPIPADQIVQTYEADVCVVGLGHSGGAAAAELSEEGFTVIALEKQLEDMFMTTGTDFGHINSKLSESLGGGSGYDPVEFFNNWMLNCANAANPGLIMKFAQNCGDTIDWWYDKSGGAEAKLVFEGPNEERPHIVTQVGAFKFYCTSVNFYDAPCVLNSKAEVEARDPNSKYLFGYAGAQLVTDEAGKVCGVVAQNVETEEYIQVNAKAVLLATGGFGGDREMARDILLDIQYALQPNDQFNLMGMDRTGDGIKMAYWLGGKMELNPATNDGKASWQTSSPALVPMLAHPQGIHLDYTGRRFYNEYWGPIETRSRPLMTRNRDVFLAVYDDNLPEYMQYVPASHGTTNPKPETLQKARDILDAAYAVKGTGYYDEASKSTWYAGDSIDEVVGALGLDEKVAANVKASVESWNACVAAGSDSQFGRDAQFLFPIEQGPFYIEVNEGNVVLGNFLVSNGALYTDADQRVLGDGWMPIEGLFATGNNTGGRFGWDYFSPAYGVSCGIATTLGREAGRSIGQYLNGELV